MSMDGRYPENAGAIFRVCMGWTANFQTGILRYRSICNAIIFECMRMIQL